MTIDPSPATGHCEPARPRTWLRAPRRTRRHLHRHPGRVPRRRFAAPFAEPTVGGPTTEKCMRPPTASSSASRPRARRGARRRPRALLGRARGHRERRAQHRRRVRHGRRTTRRACSRSTGRAPSWTRPTPVDGGANPDGSDPNALPGMPDNNGGADGALFCADLVHLADGRILAAGGTNYYSEPGMDPIPFGLIELEGLKNTRIFDRHGDHWAQTDAWLRPLVSDAGHAARRGRVRRERRHQAGQADLSRAHHVLGPQRRADRDLRRRLRHVVRERPARRAHAADVPAPAPAAERPRLLQHRRAGVRSVRLRLRHGALERRRRLRSRRARGPISPTRACRWS